MDWDWFRWVGSSLLTVVGAITGYLAYVVNSMRDREAELDKRLAVVESKLIDPILYTKAMTEVTNALVTLTQRLAENVDLIQRQNIDLREQNEALETRLTAVERELHKLVALHHKEEGLAR